MSLLKLEAFCCLVEFDFRFARNFARMHKDMLKRQVRRMNSPRAQLESICAAVDFACTWYWKDVLCLQRSAVTAWMLRQHGIEAALIIGVQQFPFEAHAWVEVDGRVANDKAHVSEIYAVLDRL